MSSVLMIFLGIAIGIISILGIIYSRIITTFIHELGHAIPALFLTKGKVIVSVGSYGMERSNLRLELGRLRLYLNFNIWRLNIGMCSNQGIGSRVKTLIIILGGPLMSLVSAAVFLYFILGTNVNEGIKFVLAILVISAIIDFFVNIIPSKIPIKTDDGSILYSDGTQIKMLLGHKPYGKEIDEIIKLSDENKEGAISELQELMKNSNPQSIHYELLLNLIFSTSDFRKYIQCFTEYKEEFKPGEIEIANWARSKIAIHEYDDVIKSLTQLIFKGKSNYDFHYLRGKALTELGEYRDALVDYHSLTLGDEEDPRALANRAYCQFRLGFKEEAREDVEQAVNAMKSHKAEILFLAGMIFMDTDNEKSHSYFKKSKDLGYTHHALDFNLAQLEAK